VTRVAHPAGDYIFLYGSGNKNRELDTGFFVRKAILPAVKRVDFVSDVICNERSPVLYCSECA
jgi:hypothetical protein